MARLYGDRVVGNPVLCPTLPIEAHDRCVRENAPAAPAKTDAFHFVAGDHSLSDDAFKNDQQETVAPGYSSTLVYNLGEAQVACTAVYR